MSLQSHNGTFKRSYKPTLGQIGLGACKRVCIKITRLCTT
uniref:Uncharacterized protein n=1 Tax=Anguilla anguilla TaxID=7936 RepID=A0A0E9VMM9_ANGAN